MSLPTTGLTLHLRADRTNNLFTTYNASGVHSGVPVDGSAVQVWDDEGDGVSDVIARFASTSEPLYRTATPLMFRSCLDFDGIDNVLYTKNQTGINTKALSSFIANNAFTVAISIYPEVIDSSQASIWNNDGVIADAGAFWGLFLKDESGTKKVYGFNQGGSANSIGATINTGHSWVIIFRHDSGNIKLTTIDESLVETNPTDVASGNTTSLTNEVRIGRNWSGSVDNWYDGLIGEIAIYNVSVTGSDFTDLKNYFIAQWLTPSAVAGLPFVATIGAKRF